MQATAFRVGKLVGDVTLVQTRILALIAIVDMSKQQINAFNAFPLTTQPALRIVLHVLRLIVLLIA